MVIKDKATLRRSLGICFLACPPLPLRGLVRASRMDDMTLRAVTMEQVRASVKAVLVELLSEHRDNNVQKSCFQDSDYESDSLLQMYLLQMPNCTNVISTVKEAAKD